jgi:branched-chain amino acid transport system ATP-binding protein
VSRFGEVEAAARRALVDVGLDDRAGARVDRLSHGEQRQLEIALALAGHPRVLLLDEPAAGLSQAEARHMTALLRGLDRTITMLIIEHDMDMALGIAEQVTVLHDGRVIADGSREAVRADPAVREIYLGG